MDIPDPDHLGCSHAQAVHTPGNSDGCERHLCGGEGIGIALRRPRAVAMRAPRAASSVLVSASATGGVFVKRFLECP